MKKVVLILVVLSLIFVGCKSPKTEKSIQDYVKINLSEFDSVASRYVDDTVVVEGIVDHVCKHGGKKILLVNEDGTGRIHVESDKRFEDSLMGKKVAVVGIVRQLIVDEQYLANLESEDMKKHSEGKDREELLKERKRQAEFYRDSMKKAGVDHLTFYHLDFVSFK